MASGPITSWQLEREKVEAMRDFIFLGSKITVDSDCSHEIKRHLFLGRKIIYIVFLDSTYMHYYTILVYLLTHFTLYDSL